MHTCTREKYIVIPSHNTYLFFWSTWWYRVQELRLKKSNNIERPSSLFIYERTEFFSKFWIRLVCGRQLEYGTTSFDYWSTSSPPSSIMNVHVTKNDSHAITLLPVKKWKEMGDSLSVQGPNIPLKMFQNRSLWFHLWICIKKLDNFLGVGFFSRYICCKPCKLWKARKWGNALNTESTLCASAWISCEMFPPVTLVKHLKLHRKSNRSSLLGSKLSPSEIIMHQSIPAAPIPPPPRQLRGICPPCQSREVGH